MHRKSRRLQFISLQNSFFATALLDQQFEDRPVRRPDLNATRAELNINTVGLRMVIVLTPAVTHRDRLRHMLDLLSKKNVIVCNQLIRFPQKRIKRLVGPISCKRHSTDLISADQSHPFERVRFFGSLLQKVIVLARLGDHLTGRERLIHSCGHLDQVEGLAYIVFQDFPKTEFDLRVFKIR